MLVQNLPETRLSAGKSLLARDTVSTVLKISALCILLFAVVCMFPVSASPLDGEVLPSADRDSLETDGIDRLSRQNVLETFSDTKAALTATQRELKQRGSQRKQLLSSAYQTYAESGVPVFFSESPVVTGLSLPDGVTGLVHLLTNAGVSGPKCREVFDVFELSLENYPKGYEAVIRYTLSLEEIEENGNSPEDIRLYIADRDGWKMLPTEYYMDSSRAYFESVTTSLGVFAIVLEECESAKESVSLPSRSLEPVRITLDISPVSILTHPLSYSATAE